jgi:hypothetical protein
MKTILLFLLMSLFIPLVAAQEVQKVKVDTFEKDFKAQKLGDRYLVNDASAPAPQASSAPSPELIDGLLFEAGLNKKVAGLDQLAKDLLYHHARTYSLEKLQTKYPQFEKAELQKLKELVKHD